MSLNKYGIGDEVVAFAGKKKAEAFTIRRIVDYGKRKPNIYYGPNADSMLPHFREKDLTPYAQADY